MSRVFLAVTLAAVVTGCAGMTGPDGIFYRQSQQVTLSQAVTLMDEGKPAKARDLLANICAGKGVEGVTDEALFRLALLRLDAGQTGDGAPRARKELERLKKEYPSSMWAPLAAQIAGYLAATEDLNQQTDKLKESNYSLVQENKDLRQRLEKLKKLDLDLGHKTGR
jgi:hypothetical protein